MGGGGEECGSEQGWVVYKRHAVASIPPHEPEAENSHSTRSLGGEFYIRVRRDFYVL